MRWTAPMNAPSPPPTMPMRSLRFHDSMARTPDSAQAENLAIGGRVALAPGKVVKGHLGRLDNVAGDEPGAFCRPLRRTFDATLPLHDCPAGEPHFRQQCE